MAERILEDTESKAKQKAKVQCLPFFSTLLAVGNPKIDYFSLDVDGPELQILHSIPWKKVSIGLFFKARSPGVPAVVADWSKLLIIALKSSKAT